MDDNQTIELVQVRWDGLMIYKYWTGRRPGRGKDLLFDRGKRYKGVVTDGTKKRLLKAIDILIQLSKLQMIPRPGGKRLPFRLGFWTLTVPGQVRKATDVHPIFKNFLAWMRRSDIQYIWKAEYQQRGQVHYHLICNKYVPWVEIRNAWNKRLKKSGFLDSYARQCGHFNPNSVDVRSVRSNKALSIYLAKYLTKDHKKIPAGGLKKWWGASRAVMGDRFCTEMWEGDWDALKNADLRVEDPDGRWLMIKGNRSKVLSSFSDRQYLEWRKIKRKEL